MDWRFFEEKDLYWIQEISEDFLKESAWGNRVEINKEKVIKFSLELLPLDTKEKLCALLVKDQE